MDLNSFKILTLIILTLIFNNIVFAEDSNLSWEQIQSDKIGFRNNSFIFYHQKNNKFYILGGVRNDKWTKKSKIPVSPQFITVDADSYDVQPFVPMGKLPKNKKGKSYFPGAGGRAYVSQENVLYCVDKNSQKSFSIYKYDFEKKSMELLSSKKPIIKHNGIIMGEYGFAVSIMKGSSLVYDVHNKELLFIGGHTVNAHDGFVGHWAFDVTNKSWRIFENIDKELGGLRTKTLFSLKNLREIQGLVSNEYFNAKQTDELKNSVVKRLTKSQKEMELLKQGVNNYKGKHHKAVKFSMTKLQIIIDEYGKIIESIKSAGLTSKAIKSFYNLDNILDEVADLFLEYPSERKHAGIVYNEKTKKILYFGGDHGNYLLNDTWIYDCTTKLWIRQFPEKSPEARLANNRLLVKSDSEEALLLGGQKYIKRFIYFRRHFDLLKDAWKFDFNKMTWDKIASDSSMRKFSCSVGLNSKNVLFGIASSGKWAKLKATYWKARLNTNNIIKDNKAFGPDSRIYFSVVNEYNPEWYIEDKKPKTSEVNSWVSTMPKNTWVNVPKSTKPCPTRDWGTAVFDPHRDQFYHWTGGHMADPSDIVSTYHVGTNKWSIPYTATYLGKGISFEGRPDCMNHTYLNYAFDPVSKKLIISSTGGLFIFDPEIRQYEKPISSSHFQHSYFTKLKSTPYGVLGWVSKRKKLFALFNAEKRVWEKIPLAKGSPFPLGVHGDEAAFEYDSKRDCMWFFTAKGYRDFDGGVMKYDFKNKTMKVVDTKNNKKIGSRIKNLRETAYLVKHDIVLHNGFLSKDGQLYQICFDPEKNSWALLPVQINSRNKKIRKDLGGVSIGLMYDAKRDIVWAMSVGKRMYAFKPSFDKKELIYDFVAPIKKKK